MITAFHSKTHDGLNLAGTHHACASPEAMLLVVHGFGEHQSRYDVLVKHFLKNNMDVITYDQRGHGDSEGRRAYVADFLDFVRDLEGIVAKAKTLLKPKMPLHIFGHSMGGQVVLNHLASDAARDFKSAITSSANIRVGWTIPPLKLKAGTFLAQYFPKLRLPKEVHSDWISTLAEEVAIYDADPKIPKFITLGLAQQILENQKGLLEKAAKIKTPIFMMHGGADKICAREGSVDFFKNITILNKKLKIYEGAYHEILNDFTRREVLNDLTDWLSLPGK